MRKSQKLAHFQVPRYIYSPAQTIKEQGLKTKDMGKNLTFATAMRLNEMCWVRERETQRSGVKSKRVDSGYK